MNVFFLRPFFLLKEDLPFCVAANLRNNRCDVTHDVVDFKSFVCIENLQPIHVAKFVPGRSKTLVSHLESFVSVIN